MPITGAEPVTFSISRLAGGGAGVGRVNGKTVFMELSAPGDVVTGRIIEEKQNWAKAELLELVEASPLRVPPVCALYGRCGGCSLQHLDYPAQLREKASVLVETLKRIGGWEQLPELEIVPSPPYEYRNRMQLHRAAGTVGLMGRRSGDVIPLEDCPAADPLIRRALRERRIQPPEGRERFTVYGRGETLLCEDNAGGFPAKGNVPVRGRELLADAGVFFQSNGLLLEALISRLLAEAALADISLPAADLYCGVGTFAAFLEGLFPRIDLIEANTAALDLARKNAPGPKNRFFAQSGEAWAAAMPRSRREYGFVIADPPRGGLSRTVRRWLCEAGPPLFAYASCDPAALARDSGDLRRGGYELYSLVFYDFYPQTAHIESLALFKNRKPSTALQSGA